MPPILDLQFHKDPRSRGFASRDLLPATARFKRVWTTRKEGPLNQGYKNPNSGHCVGFSCAGELAAKPQAYEVTNETGDKIFYAAQSIDHAEGRFYEDGATVVAGMQACRRANYFSKFVWCFGIDDTINWLVRKGPVVFGINVYTSMFNPSPEGLWTISGRLEGGHAILCHGFWPHHPKFGDILVLTNSWGRDWGLNGRVYLRVEDADRLLKEDGEVAAPTDFPVIPR